VGRAAEAAGKALRYGAGPVSALDFLEEELAQLEAAHRRRGRRTVGGAQGAHVVLDGREVVSFSSNDYLGLAAHPALAEAAGRVLARYGVGAGASRLIVGNSDLHDELERAGAAWLGTGAARLFNSGWAANTGLLPVLACGASSQIFSDEWNHASVIDGCRLARAPVAVFRHRNLAHLEEMLAETRATRRIIVSESVFSMDGDRADLRMLRQLADRYQAILVIDEAHAAGVLGDEGGGLLRLEGVAADAVVVTLGKAIGSYGALVGGSPALAEVLWNRARSLVYTTGMPPMVAASALAGIAIVRGTEGTRLRLRLRARIEELVAGLRQLGIAARDASAIVPLQVGDDQEVMTWTSRLLEAGIYVQGIRPPTVPEGTARLRVTLSASHSESDVQRLLDAIGKGLAAGGMLSAQDR
jgi:8-amino-7-oxononanoate synthase